MSAPISPDSTVVAEVEEPGLEPDVWNRDLLALLQELVDQGLAKAEE